MNPFSLPVAELKPALIGLGKIINKRSTLPVLSHVRVERTPDARIQLAVTDLDTAVVVQLDTPTEGEPAALLVPFEDLHHVVKGCRGDDAVILDQVAKRRIALRFPVAGQTIEHGCDSLPVEEFPPITEIVGEPVTLDADLRHALHEAWQCASTDETRLILNGAFLDVSKPKAHYVVGTDGRHLFSSNSFALPLAESLLVPGHRFLEWREFRENDGDWKLRLAKSEKDGPLLFELASNRWHYVARSIEGTYPNWRAIQPEAGSAQTTVEFAADGLEALIQLIARLPNHNETHFTIGVEIKGGRQRLLAKSAEQDDWRRVEVEGARPVGPDTAVLLNRHLLTKALRFGLTKLEIVDCLSPVRFSAEGRQMIIMPVRPETSPAKPPGPPVSPPAATHQEPPAPNQPPTAEPQKGEPSMPDQSDNTRGTSRSATTPNGTAEKTALETALGQIEIVRGDVRNALAGLNKLADALKQVQRDHKAGEKEIQSVRQTLRSLQSVRI
jgi:DNA polymerase III sliding clamp (beta) subunit (PCNA family)